MKTLLQASFIFFCNFAFTQGNSGNQINNEIIVRFNYKYINKEIIDDTLLHNVQINQLLNSQGLGLLNQLGIPGLPGMIVKKGFPKRSWRDTITKNIYGKEIPIPPFWATFVLKVQNDKKYCSTLKKLNANKDIITFAEPNYFGKALSVPNDSLYYRQESLNGNPLLANAGINLEEAWEIETGEKFVKVAVLDSGIDTTNADLKVLFGGYYTNPQNENQAYPSGYGNDYEGHGTAVASIIGAKRNNDLGIAGIAGGNNDNEEGVSLVDLRYSFATGSGSYYLCAGTVDAARSVGTYWTYGGAYLDDNYFLKTPGFGVHLQNNSYIIKVENIPRCVSDSIYLTTSVGDPVLVESECVLCREAYLFSYRSGIINVVARGNSGSLSGGDSNTSVEKFYPQNSPDEWIISVGASGYDGTTIRDGINQGERDAESGFYSLYGGNMDLIAPGSDSIVYAQLPPNFDTDYRSFNGTSAAAPHVTGVVALLLSHYNKDCYSNKNLSVEDVEYILEESATDVLEPGFDEVSGAGRLNAGAAIKMIENPTKQIVHPQTLLSSVEIERDTIALKYGNAFVGDGWGPISNGFPLTNDRNYQVVKVKYKNTYSFAEYGTSAARVVDYWSRGSASNSIKDYIDTIRQNAFPNDNFIFDYFDMEPYQIISNFDSVNKTISTQGNYYHFIGEYLNNTNNFIIDPNSPINTWLPINPELDTARMLVSLYMVDSLQTSWYDYPCYAPNIPYDSLYTPYNNMNEIKLNEIKVFPNPSSENITIDFGNLKGNKFMQLFDLKGQLIYEFETTTSNYYLPITTYSKGVYVLKCSNQNSVYNIKLVKE